METKQFIILEGDRRNLQAGKIRRVPRTRSSTTVVALATISILAIVFIIFIPLFI